MSMTGKKVTCNIELDLGSEEVAKLVAASLGPDNEGYVSSEIKGGTISLKAEAPTTMSLLHTVDDLLSCVAVALKAIEKKGKP